jgi:hypothetical protein
MKCASLEILHFTIPECIVCKCNQNTPSNSLISTQIFVPTMDHLHYRLNFDLDKNFITA